MAKVRVQARGAETEVDTADAAEKGKVSSSTAKRTPKYAGAVDVLRKVLKEKGVRGWYQVRARLLSSPIYFHPSSSSPYAPC